jgi:hypothetical protein
MRYEEFVGNVAERGASEVQVVEGRTAIGVFRLYLGGNSNAHVESESMGPSFATTPLPRGPGG